MPTYLTTSQVASLTKQSVKDIRKLEEKGAIRCAPGRERYRKRWPVSITDTIAQAVRVYGSDPRSDTAPNPAFNPTLAPGALARAQKEKKEKTMPSIISSSPPTPSTINEAMVHFERRESYRGLSKTTASLLAAIWFADVPQYDVFNDLAVVTGIANEYNKTRPVGRRRLTPVMARAYLLHLGLVPNINGKRRSVGKVKPSEKKRMTALPLTLSTVECLESLLPVMKAIAAAGLDARQRAVLRRWLTEK